MFRTRTDPSLTRFGNLLGREISKNLVARDAIE